MTTLRPEDCDHPEMGGNEIADGIYLCPDCGKVDKPEMDYTIRSSYGQMAPQMISMISADSDRRALERAQEYMLAVGSKVLPALRGMRPSESGEIAGFVVFRDGETIHQGVVVLKGKRGVVDSAVDLIERAGRWRRSNADVMTSGRRESYRMLSPEEVVGTIQAASDGQAMGLACEIDLRDPEGEVYTTTPFALYSEKDGHLAGIGVQGIIEEYDEDGAVVALHSFSQPVDELLNWFDAIGPTVQDK